jgi:HPt (histidine-containing phosphotransfer) domain-containing protein
MLVSFIDTTSKGLKEMQEALEKGQMEQVGDLAHKMLPPCRHIGASELSGSLKKIEEGIQNRIDSLNVAELTEKSIREFETVRELIQAHITKIN